jgi:hypothetical protein
LAAFHPIRRRFCAALAIAADPSRRSCAVLRAVAGECYIVRRRTVASIVDDQQPAAQSSAADSRRRPAASMEALRAKDDPIPSA